jgi:UDPglucose 6-dehydrogenase
MVKIGIVGLGIVGSACRFGFLKNGHEVTCFDTDKSKGCSEDSHWDDLCQTNIVYVCVPTPMKEDGSCDTSIVELVVEELASYEYKGVVAIKSTVTPGTTKGLIDKYTTEKTVRAAWIVHTLVRIEPFKDLIFVPEFLREKNPDVDMVELNRLLLVGCQDDSVYELVKECHGDFPWETMKVTPTQAELVKYFHNCFGALRVTLANEFYELAESLDVEYNPIKRAFLKAGGLPDRYFDINRNCRGWSSICFNKDLPGLLSFAKEVGVDMPMIQATVDANKLYESTPFSGTREQ